MFTEISKELLPSTMLKLKISLNILPINKEVSKEGRTLGQEVIKDSRTLNQEVNKDSRTLNQEVNLNNHKCAAWE